MDLSALILFRSSIHVVDFPALCDLAGLVSFALRLDKSDQNGYEEARQL